MSSLRAPDIAQIGRALDLLLQRDVHARVLGMRSPMRLNWPETVECRNRRFRLAWCTSELDVIERLDATDGDSGEGVVILTPLDSTALGNDVAARLPRGRLEQSDRWIALRDAFRARDVDPRLRRFRWLADLLLENIPAAGYPTAAGGMLDLESAWRALLEQVLALPDGRADTATLLTWTLDLVRLDRFCRLPDEARNAVVERLAAAGGDAPRAILAAAAAGHGGDALPIGLICGVIFGEHDPRPALREAAVRLEPLLGGGGVEPEAGRALAEAARRELLRLEASDPIQARVIQERADLLLANVRADSAAALSPALSSGLDRRMIEAADAIAAAATSQTADDAARAWRAVQHAAGHDRAGDRSKRIGRLKMAARLTLWLATPERPATQSMPAAAAWYATDGGFVDRARDALQKGDALPEVAAAYARTLEQATTRREQENRAFAMVLRDWNTGGGRGVDPLPIEKLLDEVVAPLASMAPVLLLVLDGLSFAVWRDLAETIVRPRWTEIYPTGQAAVRVAVAVMPSVTEVSRASLFCGTLTQGDQGVERAGFAAHRGLVAASRVGHPPVLFHKADLASGPELGLPVRQALADPQQKIVGVVHNAVDAQLAGSDQIELSWSAEGLRQVTALLHTARDAGRILIVTGDHGHMLEAGTTLNAGGIGDRWRVGGAAGEGEVALSGGRLRSPDGSAVVIAAWSERLRYAGRRSGYHGGASPQEALVPVAIFSAAATIPAGWVEAPPAEPAWWLGATEPVPVAVPPVIPGPNRASGGRARPIDANQPELFAPARAATADTQAPIQAAGPATATGAPSWFAALLASDAYGVQRRLAGRGAPPDEQMQALLTALAARGGRLSRASLAQALSAPSLRVGGLVNAARRVLNLDQAQILVIDGDEVIFDERLLRTQFSLGSH